MILLTVKLIVSQPNTTTVAFYFHSINALCQEKFFDFYLFMLQWLTASFISSIVTFSSHLVNYSCRFVHSNASYLKLIAIFIFQARFWMQVIGELRMGVKLKKVCYSRTPIEYEMTPYEILMDDIRSRRYTLKKVDGAIPPRFVCYLATSINCHTTMFFLRLLKY